MKPVAYSNRPEKQALKREIETIFADSEYCFLLDYSGLSVSDFATLRTELRKSDATLRVAKNAFLKVAANERGWEGLEEFFKGQTAIITGTGDPAEIARSAVSFLKKHENAVLKGAQLDSSVLSSEEIKVLSELPPKDQMRAILLGTLEAPASSFVRVLAAPLTSVLYVLTARADDQAGDDDSAA